MHIAVAIVAFNNPDDIERCLQALAASVYRNFEVVICENGGAEAYEVLRQRTPAALPAGQAIKLICAPGNVGYGAGVNICITASPDADAWWILNPDTVVDPDALRALELRLRAGDCDAVGGVIHFPDGRVESYGGRWAAMTARSFSLGHGERVGSLVDAAGIEARLSYLSGASALVNKAFLRATGPLREDYFLYCEEVEWFLRAAAAGMRLGFAPDARVLHYQGTTTGSVASLKDRPRLPVYLDVRNRLLLTRDRFPTMFPVAAVAVVLVQILRCIRHGAWHQLRYVMEGWMAGIRNERGRPPAVASAG